MKLIIAILLFSTTVWAGPFLVCDPDPDVTEYKLEWDSGATEYINAPLRYDANTLAEGDSSGNIYAGGVWKVDGEDQEVFEWSDPTPFLLTRPSKPLSPTNIGLSE